MSMPPPLPVLAPVSSRERIVSIDVLRGVAILGILVMNIQSFALPAASYTFPWAWGDMAGANGVVWHASHFFASGKFISIFAMLFGAGIVLRGDPDRAGGLAAPARVHYRRMGVLLVLGLLHGYLLWYGDILFSYAVLGMIVYLFRNLRPRTLLLVGGLVYVAGILLNLALGGVMLILPPEARSEAAAAMAPTAEEFAREIAAYQGSWVEQMPDRASNSAMMQTFLLVIYTLPFAGGLMLIGMALMKRHFFDAGWPRARYAMIAVAGCGIGWALDALQLWADARTGRDPIRSVLLWSQLNTLAMPMVALGYCSIVQLIVGTRPSALPLAPLAAVGRTALSCYLLQTLICTTVFYGHGFGLFGTLGRAQLMIVVVAVWLVLLIVAPLWLRRFRFGPAEWLWRSLTYGRRQPMRRD